MRGSLMLVMQVVVRVHDACFTSGMLLLATPIPGLVTACIQQLQATKSLQHLCCPPYSCIAVQHTPRMSAAASVEHA